MPQVVNEFEDGEFTSQPVIEEEVNLDGTDEGVQGGYAEQAEDRLNDLREIADRVWNEHLADLAQRAVDQAREAARRAEEAADDVLRQGEVIYAERESLWQRFVNWFKGE